MRERARRRIRLRVQELAGEKQPADLARVSGVDVAVIRRMYANQQVEHITVSQLARVAEAMGVETSALLSDIPPRR